jgi:GDP-D-mannose dehydratase
MLRRWLMLQQDKPEDHIATGETHSREYLQITCE